MDTDPGAPKAAPVSTPPAAPPATAEVAVKAPSAAAAAIATTPKAPPVPRMALGAFCARVIRARGPAVAAVFRMREIKAGNLFDTVAAYQARLDTYLNEKA